MEDEEYLAILNNNLRNLNKLSYDFVFYIAGVDVHFNDRLGKLKLTDEGIDKRDKIIIENYFKKYSFCGVLGGGYNKSFEKLIELHQCYIKIVLILFNFLILLNCVIKNLMNED